jgi:acetyl esterase/lipase
MKPTAEGGQMAEDLSVLTRKTHPPDLTVAYGGGPDQVGDIRYGQRGAQLPLVALIHGGFWKSEYDRAHLEAMSSALAAAGWTVLTLEYRRIPSKPDPTLQDIAAALEILPATVERHNGKLLLIGHSAGGHLVLWAAANWATAVLQGVVALAPAADLRLADKLHLGDGAVRGFLGTDPAERPDADPMQLPAPVVAVTIVQGDADEVVPPAVAASYCATFPKTRLVQLPDSGHFAVIDPLSSAWPMVVDELRKLSDA